MCRRALFWDLSLFIYADDTTTVVSNSDIMQVNPGNSEQHRFEVNWEFTGFTFISEAYSP